MHEKTNGQCNGSSQPFTFTICHWLMLGSSTLWVVGVLTLNTPLYRSVLCLYTSIALDVYAVDDDYARYIDFVCVTPMC